MNAFNFWELVGELCTAFQKGVRIFGGWKWLSIFSFALYLLSMSTVISLLRSKSAILKKIKNDFLEGTLETSVGAPRI